MNFATQNTRIVFLSPLRRRLRQIRNSSNLPNTPPWNVLFFGADDFSVYSLKDLYSEYKKGIILSNLEVVTTTKGKWNAVRKYANEQELRVHSWPEHIPSNTFDVGLVVSFGHLIPQSIIQKFHYGMLNLHASLLPRWRGAAPMIYALANGDKETGVTVMTIKPKHFDVGEILMQEKVAISNNMRLPELHESLGRLGAHCLIQSLQDLPEKLISAKPQPETGVTFAPKVTSQFAVVRWHEMCSSHVSNLDRSVDGMFSLTSSWNGIPVKLLDIKICDFSEVNFHNINNNFLKPGLVLYNKQHNLLKVLCAMRTCVSVGRIGVHGKKVMCARDFNNGYVIKEPLERRYFKHHTMAISYKKHTESHKSRILHSTSFFIVKSKMLIPE